MPLAEFAYRTFCRVYNRARIARRSPVQVQANDAPAEVQQILERARHRPSDISDHLMTLFAEAVAAHPRLIVELGVRGGESTFAFERAAAATQACLLSVDIEDCRVPCAYPKWSFVKQDDVAFAQEFPAWCAARGLPPEIEVLFIDTSHLYEHTREELGAWLPHLAARGRVILHDTNMKRIYRHADGSLGAGWNNRRGVIRAVEDTLGARFDETQDFVAATSGWVVRHWAHCNGLTVLERVG